MIQAKSFVVAQIGARMHYAVPRILQGAGMLSHFFTDISVDHGVSRIAKILPQSLDSQFIRKLRGRYVSGVPTDKITAFELIGYLYSWKLRSAKNENDRLRSFMWIEEEFTKHIIRRGIGEANSIYAFNGAALGLFERAKNQGIRCVLEQTIAPKRIENEILSQALSHRGEALFYESDLMDDFIMREETEWRLADLIVCASDFVRDGLIECGVRSEKCLVIPYGVNLANFELTGSASRVEDEGKSVNVLFVGAIGSRKGIWTLFRAMELLLEFDIKCRVVGPITADVNQLLKACPPNTEIVGPVPRSSIPGEFSKADIFCLPSLCEGSATVVYEALAAGIPVVTTRNSGSIVRDDLDGLIVPHSDEYALANAIKRLAQDRDFRLEAGKNARERSRLGSLEAYSERLVPALAEIG